MVERPTATLKKWLTLAAGVLGSATSSGIIATVIFGLTFKPMASGLGVPRRQIALAMFCFYAFNGLGALMLGHSITKCGVRRPALVFVVLFCIALYFVSVLGNSLAMFILAFAFLGLASGGVTSMPYAIGIAGWFDRGRGNALGIAVSGTGLGHIVMPKYVEWLLSHFGWRGAYAGAGAYVALIGLIALLFLYREPPVAPTR